MFLRIALFLSLTTLVSSYANSAEYIKKIVINGNSNVSNDTIISYLGIKVGDIYDKQKVSDGIKELYLSNLFSHSSEASFDAGTLRLDLHENPLVVSVEFEGDKSSLHKDLKKIISTRAGKSLNEYLLDSDIQKIKEFLKSRGSSNFAVQHDVVHKSGSKAVVKFKISKQETKYISSIRFVGNERYSSSELEGVISSRTKGLLYLINPSCVYNPGRIEYDKELLTSFYNSLGFRHFRVISATAMLAKNGGGFDVVFSVEEGEQFKFGKIEIDPTYQYVSKVKDLVPDYTGKILNLSLVEKLCDDISEKVSELGYHTIIAFPDFVAVGTGVMDVKIKIQNAPKFLLDRIEISGNVKTMDKVIRRELPFSEGDVFDDKKIMQAKEKLTALDFFEKVDISDASVDSDASTSSAPVSSAGSIDFHKANRELNFMKKNLLISVLEKSTASFGVNLGYNSTGGPFVGASITEMNLAGSGNQFSAETRFGKGSKQLSASTSNPNFLGRDLTLSCDASFSIDDKDSGFVDDNRKRRNYKDIGFGGGVSLSFPINDKFSYLFGYGFDYDKASGVIGESIFENDNLGTFKTSRAYQRLVYSSLDSKIVPKNGFLIRGTESFAGLGGNIKYLKHDVDLTYLKSLTNNITFKFSSGAGIIRGVGGHALKSRNRFHLGGASLRGFASIGPREIGHSKTFIGGEQYYRFSGEVNFPISPSKDLNIKGAVFIDNGALWGVSKVNKSLINYDTALRSSIGFGIIWSNSVVPLSIYFGYPIKKKSYDDCEVVYFTASKSL